MRIGITYGTYDVLHYGHINLLKRAKEDCDYLIVGLSTDDFNKIKGKQSYLSYNQRYELLDAIKFVDKIIPEENWEQKVEDIQKYNIDVIYMGDDWEGTFDYLDCEHIYFSRTEIISSTLIKNIIKGGMIKCIWITLKQSGKMAMNTVKTLLITLKMALKI